MSDTERKPTYEELLEENKSLKALVTELRQIIERQNQIIAQQNFRIEQLERLLYGKKSEKSKEKSNGKEPKSIRLYRQ